MKDVKAIKTPGGYVTVSRETCGCVKFEWSNGGTNEMKCSLHSAPPMTPLKFSQVTVNQVSTPHSYLTLKQWLAEMQKIEDAIRQKQQQQPWNAFASGGPSTMAPTRDTSLEAELIVRLEELMDREYDQIDSIEQLGADIKTVALCALLILRRPENSVFGDKHVYDSYARCMRCGKTRAEVEMPGAMKIYCTGTI